MFKVNKKLFPVKMHYFFFMAAMGPILPFYPLVGKQLGLTEAALGSITAVFPLFYLVLKPIIGFIADYFYQWRKFLFLGFVIATCLSFDLLLTIHDSVETVPWTNLKIRCSPNKSEELETCQIKCENNISATVDKMNDGRIFFSLDLSEVKTIKYSCMEWSRAASLCNDCYVDDEVLFTSPLLRSNCTLGFTDFIFRKDDPSCPKDFCLLNCPSAKFSLSYNFWIFTILTSFGCIFYNITNFFSDAICFDVLGQGNDKLYGYQRVWGALGFGLSALLGGYAVDLASKDLIYYDFMPAFILAAACISLDIYFSWKLKLPELCKSESIAKDVWLLIKQPRIAFFLTFATFVGILDSSIFYFLLWYIEDMATNSGNVDDIKFLQGLIVALETLGGETVSFFLSGWVLEKIGYAHSLSLGFLFYSLRLGLLSIITNPWMALPIEGFLQGPSYALLYSTIVAYASSVTPPGTSGTVQGLVAGMDDGLGISLGSLIGGLVYTYYGGSALYISYSCVACFCTIAHFTMYMLWFRCQPKTEVTETSKTYHLADGNVEMKSLEAKS